MKVDILIVGAGPAGMVAGSGRRAERRAHRRAR